MISTVSRPPAPVRVPQSRTCPPSAPSASPGGHWLDRRARKLLLGRLAGLAAGTIELRDEWGESVLGTGNELFTALQVHRPRFYRHAVAGGSLSIAESYLRGDWDCSDLTALFRLFLRDMEVADRLDRGWTWLMQWMHRAYHAWHANSREGSRRNIHAHYDLGNDFFRLMLDETMAYSSGIFLSPASTLEEASVEKFDRLCRKLALSPQDHLLEIGTGWGGLALHAAAHYGCRVTTTTISAQQFAVAQDRILQAGLGDRITLLQRDYRDLTGQFDKLVSVEMIEAVGYEYFDTFFRHCSGLLRREGTMLLQAIVMPERRYPQYLRSVDFIQRYVFPGGCLPSVGAMLESAGRTTDLRMVHLEDFGPHYAATLRAWRERFRNGRDQVQAWGYSERFLRMWEYYLCYCEAAFAEHYLGVVHIQFDRSGCRRDPQRISQAAVPSGGR